MYFVYEQKLGPRTAVGGASKLRSAKKLAEKRAGEKLVWEKLDGVFLAELVEGKQTFYYLIEEK